MLDNLLGAKLRIVTGYPGSNEIMLAIERNEVQGACGFGWSSVAPQRARLLDSGLVRRSWRSWPPPVIPELNRMGVPARHRFRRDRR